MHLKSTICKNCSHQFAGKFCNNCGQKASVGTINFKDIFHEAWHNLTHTDTGYLQLFWDLLVRPGQTIKNYLAGKRKSYFSPFTFYIVTTSLLILITNWVFKKEDLLYKTNNEFGNYHAQNINYILFYFLPIITVLLWLFFKKYFKNLAESLTVTIFMFGALNFFLLLCNIFFYAFISLHFEFNDDTKLIGYLFMLYILYSFLKPLSIWEILKLFLLVIIFYVLVEWVSLIILLTVFDHVPLNKLINF
ncbi:MAG: DUF3667 domain-containing protein [Bacteroidia bacterium]